MRRGALRREVEFLLDVLLSSVNPERVDDYLGWQIAALVKARRIYTSEGRRLLLEAVRACEPEKARERHT